MGAVLSVLRPRERWTTTARRTSRRRICICCKRARKSSRLDDIQLGRVPPDRGNTEGQPARQPPDRGNTQRETDRQPPDRGNTEKEPARQPPDRGNTEREQDRQPPDRGNTQREPDSQPPDRGNTEGESDSQVQETEEEPLLPWPAVEEGCGGEGRKRKEGRQPEEKEGLAEKARTAGDGPSTASVSGDGPSTASVSGDGPSTASVSGEGVSIQHVLVTSVAEDREVPDISIASPPCLAPTALPTSAVPSTSQTAPVARGPGEAVHYIMHGGQGNFGTVNNPGRIHHLGHNYYFDGSNQLQSIAARTSANLERACPHGYVTTLGYYTALGAIKKNNCCIITGTSGSGKTTLARHLLLTFKAEGFEAIELIKPSECKCLPWQEIRQGNRRLVLLVDNVVGAGNFEDKLRRKWEIQLKPMKPFIESGNVLVILASRANIYAAIRGVKESGQVLYEAPEVSLAGEDCQLSKQVKEDILRKTLAFHRAKLPDQVRIDDIIQASGTAMKIGFPQLCVYLATNPTALSDPETFFQNPVQFLGGEFQKLKLDDKLSYFVLILVLLQEGMLSEEFVKAKRNKEFFIEVADLVGLPKYPGHGSILEWAKQLLESYLEYDSRSKCFSFTHQSVWDVLFSDMCHSDFEQAVNVCTFKQLIMYVRTDPKSEESEDFVYVVPPCDWPILSKRLLRELTSGDADLACSHPCLQHPDFVQELLEKFLTDTDISRLLETQKEKKYVSVQNRKLRSLKGSASLSSLESHTVTIFSFQSCISYLLLRRTSSVAKHILQSAKFQVLSTSTQSQLLTEALICALYVSDFDMVDWLLDRGAVPSQECVRAACCAEQEHVGLVERALDWDSVLCAELLTGLARIACQKDRPRTLEVVLSRLPQSANTKAELDAMLAEVIILTHSKQISYNEKLSHLSCILSTLKKAGAQFRTHIDPHTAAGHRDPSALSEWLEHEVDLSATDKDGYTLLHQAAETGALSNVHALLDIMESTGQLAQLVNIQTRENGVTELTPSINYGDTALHLAAAKGRLAVMEALLNKGADASLTNDDGETALWRLVDCRKWEMEGYMSPSEDQGVAFSSPHSSGFQSHMHPVGDIRVKNLLRMIVANTISFKDSFFRNPPTMTLPFNETPLHIASSNGHCVLVEVLVERGVDVNVRYDRGRSPVHYAAEKGHVCVLEVLYRNEAQLDARDSKGKTALHVAVRWGHFPVVEMLIQNEININTADERERTPLHGAAEIGHDQIVKCLLDNGATVNVADEDGQQPLHLAAGGGHLLAVKCLVEGGASVNAKCRDGRTCLHFASGAGDVATVGLLLTHGASVNASNNSGLTPLHWALKEKRFYAAQFLMCSGADADVADQSGNTILHCLAASKVISYFPGLKYQEYTAGMASIVKSLSGLVNHQNKQEDTPAMLAVKNRNYEVLRELLRLQCDLSISNDAGNTVLHLAAAQEPRQKEEKAAEECMSIISAKCVKLLDVKNLNGNEPLLLAASAGNFFVLKRILKHPVDLSVKGRGGNTILHELVCGLRFTNGNESVSEIVETLVKRCPDLIKSTNDEGVTPVLAAAREGKWFLLSLFLKQKCNVRACDRRGNTLLHYLAKSTPPRQHQTTVKAIIADLAELVDRPNEDGDSALLVAARRETVWMVRELVTLQCNVRLRNRKGETALFLAIKHGDFSVVELLLEQDVDVNILTEEGSSLLHALAVKSGLDIYYGTNLSVRNTVLTLLEKCKFFTSRPNSRGETPLYLAFLHSNLCVADLLLEQAGPSVDCREGGLTDKPQEAAGLSVAQEGVRTPLHGLAASSDLQEKWKYRPEVREKVPLWVKRLSHWVNHPDPEGNTPILLALINENLCVVEQLVQCGADFSVTDAEGNTVLHALIHLVEYDCYYKESKETKAYKAVAVKVTELAKAAGVTPLTPNKEGKTALDVLRRKHEELLSMPYKIDKTELREVRWHCILRDLWSSEEKTPVCLTQLCLPQPPPLF